MYKSLTLIRLLPLIKESKYIQFVAVAIAADLVRIASGEYSAGTLCSCLVSD